MAPCSFGGTLTLFTYSDYMPAVTIQLYEGDHAMAKDYHNLGQFNLMGFSLGPGGMLQIEVPSDADSSAGKQSKFKITNNKGRLRMQEIEHMVSDAKMQTEKIYAKYRFAFYFVKMKNTLNDVFI